MIFNYLIWVRLKTKVQDNYSYQYFFHQIILDLLPEIHRFFEKRPILFQFSENSSFYI